MSLRELLMNASSRIPLEMGFNAGAGLAAGKRQATAGDFAPAVENTAAPGFREHPPRPGLDRVERDNPVGVRTIGPVSRP